MRVWTEGETVIKAAEDDAERERLGHEAAVLRRVAHPGVVELIGVDGDPDQGSADRLVLARVAGPTLAERGVQPPEVVAGWAAQVATTLADLHDIGWAHGHLRAEHVLLGDGDRPVLCGFSRAERVAWGEPDSRANELRTIDEDMLVGLILDQVSDRESPLHRVVGRWARRRRGGLRGLARELTHAGHGLHVGPRRRPRSRPARIGVVGLVGVVGLGLVIAVSGLVASGGSSGPARLAARVPVPADILETGSGGAITAIGNWGCGPARPAVLDTEGRLWVFPSAPGPGERVTARLVGRIPGATGLSGEADGPGCDRLTVLRGAETGVNLPLLADG